VDRTPAGQPSDHNRTVLASRTLRCGLACLVLLAGCGGGDESPDGPTFEEVLAAVEGLSGDETARKLAELAAQEDGRLSMYSSLSDEVGTEIADRFAERYDVDVSIYTANSNVVAQRLSEEAAAGHRGADLAELSTTVLITLARNGVLAKGLPVDTEGIDEVVVDESWVAVRHNRFAVSWNTERVLAGTQPRRWEDLADPRWNGKLALELEDHDWYAGLRGHWAEQGKSAEEIDRLFEDMAQGAKVIKGHSLLGQLTASGEVSVAASNFSHIVDRAPLRWTPAVEPTFLRAQGMGIVAGARRPATAALFIQWALTEGQALYAENEWVPARRIGAAKDDLEQVVLDVKRIAAEEQRWIEEYNRLVRRGTLVAED
jgi:iron(III) transport system substrate-binding protein